MNAYAIEVLKQNGEPYQERQFVKQWHVGEGCYAFARCWDVLTLATKRRSRDWLIKKATAYMDRPLRVVKVTIGGPVE